VSSAMAVDILPAEGSPRVKPLRESDSPSPMDPGRSARPGALDRLDAPSEEWGPELALAFHGAVRVRHLALRTEKAYRGWIRRCLGWSDWRPWPTP